MDLLKLTYFAYFGSHIRTLLYNLFVTVLAVMVFAAIYLWRLKTLVFVHHIKG